MAEEQQIKQKVSKEQAVALFAKISQNAWVILATLDKYFSNDRLVKLLLKINRKGITVDEDEVLEYIRKTTGVSFKQDSGEEEKRIIV